MLPVLRHVFLGPGRHARCVHAHLGQDGLQPADALLEAVQQRELQFRHGDGQRRAGETGAAAHVDHCLAPQVLPLKQGQRVEKVQFRHGPGLGDGRQIHHLVLLQQQPAELAQPVQLPIGEGQAQGGQARRQRLFHGRSFTISARKVTASAVWLRMAWVWPSAQNSASPACSSYSTPSSATMAEPLSSR